MPLSTDWPPLPRVVPTYEVFDVVERANDGMPYSRSSVEVIGTYPSRGLAEEAVSRLTGPAGAHSCIGYGVARRLAPADALLHEDTAARLKGLTPMVVEALLDTRRNDTVIVERDGPRSVVDEVRTIGGHGLFRYTESDVANGFAPACYTLSPKGRIVADSILLIRRVAEATS